MRLCVGKPLETDAGQIVHRQFPPLLFAHPGEFRTQRHVFRNGTPGQQRIFLKNHAALFSRTRNGGSFIQHLALRRHLKPGDDAQPGRFSAAGRAEQADKFFAGHSDIGPVERQDALSPVEDELLAYPSGLYERIHRDSLCQEKNLPSK
ncbi:hypothetical protein SDC9_111416 [bioreactor metagenome]|uniref:Uncharacterized protein n=1 Tax=bioreactor metagenome TaxID=1076179 RepID=A0A645BGG3_9ZZZZ